MANALGISFDYLLGTSNSPRKETSNIDNLNNMTGKSVINLLKKPFQNIPDDTLIIMCNNIYDYMINGNGIIPETSELMIEFNKLHELGRYQIMYDMANDVLDEAAQRYSPVVKAMMLKRPYMFIAKKN